MHAQLVHNSWMGWHQDEASSVTPVLVSPGLRSLCLWSAVFWWRSASCKNNLGMCVRPLSVSFRDLGVQ